MRKVPLLLLTIHLGLLCHSQSGLHIISTTTFTIRANTTIAMDGLVLTPSSHYVVTGSNNLARASTLLHPSITPAIKRSFQWAATLPPFTGSIGFYYEDAELNGLAEADLTLNIHDGINWQAYKGGATRNTVTNIVTTPVSGLLINELALAAEAHPLPLKWGKITATRKKEATLVEWETHSEIATAFFEVERSKNGLNWNAIGQPVQAYNKPGSHQYQFLDSSTSNSKTFYRVKQVDVDDHFSYSVITWVPALHQPATVSIYPNPAYQQLTVRSAELPLQALRLFDANGKLIKTEIVPNTLTYTLPISSLLKGMYMVQAQLADGSVTHLSFMKN